MTLLIGIFPFPLGWDSAVVFTTPLFWWPTRDKKGVSSSPCTKLLYMHRHRSLFWVNFLCWNILDLQKSWKEKDSVYSHPVPSNICICHTSTIRSIKLRTHMRTLVLTKLPTLFVVHQLFSRGLFSVPDPAQGITVPFVIVSPESHPICDNFQIFPCFAWLWQFERAQVMYFLDCPSI